MADTFPKNTIDDNGLKKVWDMVMNRLGLKVDKEAGKGLSTNDYTTTEKNKLAGIANGAEVNTVTSVAGKTGAVTLDKSDVGLSNVGNFKAVSTSANQGLTNTEKSNARANIDTPSNGDIQSSKTIKSSVVTVTDAAPINAEDITVDITPIQDLHGYGKPWAGGAGKNKLPMTVAGIKAANTYGTWSGNSYTVSGVTFTINTDDAGNVIGITSNNGGNAQITLVFTLPAGTYILSSGFSETIYSTDTYLRAGTTVIARGNSGTPGQTFALSESTEINWNFRVSSTAVVCTPMIRLASETDSTFAPYSNECPLEGWTGAELDRVGKNEYIGSPSFDGYTNRNSYSLSSETHNGHEVIYKSGIWGGAYKTLNLSKGTYTFSVMVKCSATTTVSLYDTINGESTQLAVATVGTSWQRVSTTFEVTEQRTASLRINLQTSNTTIYISEYQLELGSTATTYEPYQGEQYPASFGETVYGGKWHVTAGGTDKTYGYVEFDGSDDEDWAKYTSGSASAFAMQVTISNFSGISSSIDKLSANYLQTIPASATWGNYDSWISAYGVANKITTGLKSITTVEEWRAYLAQHPLQICYELATPTTISTPKQNVPMLQGINTVSADCGDTSLKYQPDNVIGELKGEIQELESELDKLDRAYMTSDTFSERGIDGEYQITRIGNEIHIAAIIDDASIATQTGSVDLIADLPDEFKCDPSYGAVLALRHSSGTGKIEFKINPGTTRQSFYMYVEEVNTTSGIWFPIYDVPGKVL